MFQVEYKILFILMGGHIRVNNSFGWIYCHYLWLAFLYAFDFIDIHTHNYRYIYVTKSCSNSIFTLKKRGLNLKTVKSSPRPYHWKEFLFFFFQVVINGMVILLCFPFILWIKISSSQTRLLGDILKIKNLVHSTQ